MTKNIFTPNSVYTDLVKLDEDSRITVIGQFAMGHLRPTAFTVDDLPKAERYIAKLKEKFPGIQILETTENKPIVGVVYVKVAPPVVQTQGEA